MKKLWIAGIIAVAGVSTILLPRFLKDEPFAEEVPAPVVQVQKPQIGDIRLTTGLIGRVEPSDMVYLYPKISGDVTEVMVNAGDSVKQGEIICNIDTKQVETFKRSLESAELRLKQSQEDLSRYQPMYEMGYISQQEYERYRDNVSSAQIQYSQAKYDYETQISYSRIAAPIDGKVEICNMEPYDSISPNALLCVISGTEGQIVSFSATERIRDFLRMGDVIQVEKAGKEYEGTIYEIGSMTDDNTGLYRIKAHLETKTALPSGSEVKLYVTTEHTENAVTIPLDAVYYENNGTWVYTLEDGPVHQREIRLGVSDSTRTEVLSGPTMSDSLITTWSSELYEGAKVLTEQEDSQ